MPRVCQRKKEACWAGHAGIVHVNLGPLTMTRKQAQRKFARYLRAIAKAWFGK